MLFMNQNNNTISGTPGISAVQSEPEIDLTSVRKLSGKIKIPHITISPSDSKNGTCCCPSICIKDSHINTLIVMTKCAIFTLVCIGVLTAMKYYIDGIKWNQLVVNEEWSWSNCNEFGFVRRDITNKLWYDILETQHEYIDFSIGNIPDKYTYDKSVFNMMVNTDLLRQLTFNIIQPLKLDVIIKTNCTLESSSLISILRDTNNNGILHTSSDSYNVETGEKFNYDSSRLYMAIFFTFNGFVWLFLASYTAIFGGKFLYKEWNNNSDYWANRYFEGCKDDFYKHNKEACGPVFLLDHIIGDIHKNRIQWDTGILSCIVHCVVAILSITMFMLFAWYNSIASVRLGIFYFLCGYMTLLTLYMYTYYFNLKWSYRQYVSFPLYFCTLGLIALSYAYIIMAFLWFLICIIIKPATCAGIIIFGGTIAFYMIKLPGDILKMRKQLDEETQNANNILQHYGMSTKDIIMAVVLGAFLLIFLSIWILMAWYIYNLNSSFAQLITSLAVPTTAFATRTMQLRSIQKKIKLKKNCMYDV